MMFLKQSTAATVKIGPFLDDTDGKSAETGLTLSQADIRLSKNGGDMAQKHESTTCTHDEIGYYDCPLDTTDTGTCGILLLMVHESGALPVWNEFMVVAANVFDSLFAAATTDYLQVDVTQLLGTAWLAPGTAGTPDVNVKLISDDATAANNCELMFDGTGYAGGTTKLDVNVASQADIDFGTTQKTSIGTAVNGQLTAANTELAAVPGSTGGLRAMIQYLFEKVRHKGTFNKDTGVETLFKDNGSDTLGTATHSDDGTTVTRGEMS